MVNSIKSRRSGILKLTVSLLLVISLLLLSSCASGPTDEPLTKDELYEAIENPGKTSSSNASKYLDRWGFPKFDTTKLNEVQWYFTIHFIEDLPDAYNMAKSCGKYFLDNYYDAIDITDTEAVTNAIINSYVSSIDDDYAIYRTKAEIDTFVSDMSGTFCGIGITVEHKKDEGKLTIVSVMPGSPAEEAGFKAGDLIHAVDGSLMSEIGYSNTVDSIRGEEGTPVSLTVIRDGEELTLTATRRTLTEATVHYEISDDKIGYIKITQFKANTAEQFGEALEYMNLNEAKGIVFDLRSNPGGYLNAVINTLDCLVPTGTRIASYNYAGRETVYTAKNDDALNVPCVVICDEYTASAGELFTAAVRDFGDMGLLNECIVGKTTFGKGIMQNTYSLSDDSTITMTVAYYYPPSVVNYHGIGVKPDSVAERGEEDDGQLQAAFLAINALLAVN